MSAMLDYHGQYGGGIPHRKPLPNVAPPPPHVPQSFAANDALFSQQSAHSRTRTSSSAALPPSAPMSHHHHHQQQQQQQAYNPTTRRTLSNATSSTSSTANSGTPNPALARAPTGQISTYASSIRRSTSSRSTAPTSYVALMRKQKATVWCDRAQHEDPRMLAQQRAAKARAQMEVVGGANGGRISTSSGGGVRSKIRHHGAVKAQSYNPTSSANLSGAGVPMRLSASEVDEGDSDDEDRYAGYGQRYHQRNDSGRSSLGGGSTNRMSSLTAAHGSSTNMAGMTHHNAQQQQQQHHHHHHQNGRFSNGSTPTSVQSYSPVEEEGGAQAGAGGMGHLAGEETPVPESYVNNRGDYFQQPGGQGSSGGSGSSEERFGDVGGLPQRSRERQREEQRKTSEELRRRGSVDDRTMTMSGVRLFVANPDLSD